MTGDINFILVWWLVLFLIGVVSIPLGHLIFEKFTDLGYGLLKTLGVLLISYLVFLAGIFKILPFERTTIVLFLFLFVLVNATVFFKKREEIIRGLKEKVKVLITQEVLFTAGFVIWALVRGFHPEINGLEKFMDYGFMNSILNSRFLPPPDMWFAGEPINYYWFGHLTTAVMTKLTNVPSGVAYNLAIAGILGVVLTSSFSIISTLISTLKLKRVKKAAFAAGLISAIILTFGGNFHTPIYALKDGVENYWYPDATRFIGYNPETNDKTIHEFPIYSFVVSDLHAHLINLPFVLLFIALLFTAVSTIKNKKEKATKREGQGPRQHLNHKLEFFKKINISDFEFRILLLGFVLGIMFMTNTWDFANYSLLAGVVFLVFYLKELGLNFKSILSTAISVGMIVATGLLVTLPFLFHFESIAKGIVLTKTGTPLWQLGVLWGFPAILTLIFLYTVYKKWPRLKTSDFFVLSLLLVSWLLIAIPEVLYVEDIYSGSHKRANTMFKLTYQAFVMTYLAGGYILVRSLTSIKNLSKKLGFLFFVLVLLSSVLAYPYFAVNSFYRDLEKYEGLNGESWLERKNPDTYKAIAWLRENTKGQPAILEAPGNSYTEFNVISSYTGLPTVSGWFVHEWLWRGEADIPQSRVNDIEKIYTSEDLSLTRRLLNKYGVKYVVVGPLEHQKYPNLNEEKFTQLGTVVFASGDTKIYKVENAELR